MSRNDSYAEGIDDPEDRDWDELRSLFVGNEKVEIEKLTEFLENPEILVKKIAKSLPDAIRLITQKNKDLNQSLINALQPIIEKAIQQSAISDPNPLSEGLHMCLPNSINMGRERSKELTESLAESLTPLIEKAVQNSSQLDIKPLSEGLYPIIGPAIRKAVAAAFKQINQTLNNNLNKTLSVSAIKWRIQSLTTGKPFLDIVAQHTLAYQVKQVFLIHKETGLLLVEAEAPNIASKDADMVSAMLKAIQDFVQDSFSVEKNEELSTIEVGENTIWIEQGPKAILAGVIFGNAPLSVRDRFIKALEKIHIDFAKDLSEFDGDTMVFETNPQYLKYCFQEQLKQDGPKSSRSKWIIIAILILVGGFFGTTRFLESRRWSGYVEKLESQPGIIVLKEGRKEGKFAINGLRTIDSINPAGLMDEFQLTSQMVMADWKIIRFTDPQVILRRAIQMTKPPETVTLTLEGATLVAAGSADLKWVAGAEAAIREIGEITSLNTTDLKVTDAAQIDLLKRVATLTGEINGAIFYFPVASAVLTAEQSQSVQNISRKMNQLIKDCVQLQKKVVIQVKGYADAGGKRELNEQFAGLRAQAVASILLREGIQQDLIETQAFVEERDTRAPDPQSKRRATINVTILDQ
ncbi:OmpA family protein [bacterium]|nr:OmpA family protein [bacterium]